MKLYIRIWDVITPNKQKLHIIFKFLENLTFSELVVDIKLKQSYLSMQIFKNHSMNYIKCKNENVKALLCATILYKRSNAGDININTMIHFHRIFLGTGL